MTQYEVYDFLRDNPDKWYTTTEIEVELGINHKYVANACRQLRKHGMIEFKVPRKNRKRPTEYYVYRISSRKN